jgi:hypothetical protein
MDVTARKLAVYPRILAIAKRAEFGLGIYSCCPECKGCEHHDTTCERGQLFAMAATIESNNGSPGRHLYGDRGAD